MRKAPLVTIAVVLAALLGWWALSGRRADDGPAGPPTSPDSRAATTPDAPTAAVLRAASAGRDATAPRSALAGLVLDATTKKPIVGAAVSAVGYEDLRRFETLTRDDGTFAVVGTAGRTGALHLSVRAAGYGRFADPSARPGGVPRTILLESEGSLAGRLVEDADGSPVPRYRVAAMRRLERFSDDQSLRDALPDEQVFDASVAVDDAEGRFRVAGLPAGTFALVFLVENRHPFFWSGGGASYEKTGLAVAAGGAADAGTIRLPRTDRIVVRVLDAATERPLAGATFDAGVDVDGRTTKTPLRPVEVADVGEYVLALAFDASRRLLPTQVTVRVVGYASGAVLPSGQAPGSKFEVRLPRTASVKGTVRSGDAPAAGLVLVIRRSVDRAVLATVTSGPAGEFTFLELPSTTELELLVFEPAADRLRLVVPLALGGQEARVLALGGADATGIEGRLAVRGAPVAEAWIFLDVGRQRIHCPTDVDGRFRFEAIPAGTHPLFVNGDVVDPDAPAYLSRSVTVVEGKMTSLAVDLSLEIRGTLAVRKEDRSPGSAEKMSVVAHAVSTDGAEWVPETRTRADGSFTLLVPGTGRWLLDLDEQDLYLAAGPVPVDVPRRGPAAEPVNLVATEDAKVGTIEISVLDAETGEPVFEPEYRYEYRHTSAAGSAEKDESVVRAENAGLGLYRFVIGADDRVWTPIDVELTLARRTVRTTVSLPRSDAVLVKAIEAESRGAAEGLRAGDLILRYGEAPTRNLGEFQAAKAAASPSDRVRLEIVRNGSPTTIDVPAGRLGIRLENARVPR